MPVGTNCHPSVTQARSTLSGHRANDASTVIASGRRTARAGDSSSVQRQSRTSVRPPGATHRSAAGDRSTLDSSRPKRTGVLVTLALRPDRQGVSCPRRPRRSSTTAPLRGLRRPGRDERPQRPQTVRPHPTRPPEAANDDHQDEGRTGARGRPSKEPTTASPESPQLYTSTQLLKTTSPTEGHARQCPGECRAAPDQPALGLPLNRFAHRPQRPKRRAAGNAAAGGRPPPSQPNRHRAPRPWPPSVPMAPRTSITQLVINRPPRTPRGNRRADFSPIRVEDRGARPLSPDSSTSPGRQHVVRGIRTSGKLATCRRRCCGSDAICD